MDLRRLGPEDFVRCDHNETVLSVNSLQRAAMQAQRAKLTPEQRKGILARIRRLIFTSPKLLLDSLRLLLPTAIFFVKFLEWWYAPGSPARALSATPTGPVVPPPRMLPPHPQGIPFDPTSLGTCPVCCQPINNATALPSGYVYCYRCAYEEVEEHGRCPVRLLPAQMWQLRKVLV